MDVKKATNRRLQGRWLDNYVRAHTPVTRVVNRAEREVLFPCGIFERALGVLWDPAQGTTNRNRICAAERCI